MVADYQILICTDEHHVIPVKNIFYNDKRNGGVKEKNTDAVFWYLLQHNIK